MIRTNRFARIDSQRTKNGAFVKPCLCPQDTRHFRHFRRPLSYWLERKFVIFAVSVKKKPSFWRDKGTVYQKHPFLDPDYFLFMLFVFL